MSKLVTPVQSRAEFEMLQGQLVSYLPDIQKDGRVQAKRAIVLDRKALQTVRGLRT
jgi:hypothetical protein